MKRNENSKQKQKDIYLEEKKKMYQNNEFFFIIGIVGSFGYC